MKPKAAVPSPAAEPTPSELATTSSVIDAVVLKDLVYDVPAPRGGSFRIVGPVSLAIQAGEWLTFVGPSGCGKSTLLSLIAGFLVPTTGKVTTRDAAGLPSSPAVCFQQDTVFQSMTAEAQLRLVDRCRATGSTNHLTPTAMLALLQLDRCKNTLGHRLSGGERKRVELGRAWLSGRHIVALDETLSSVDYLLRVELQHTLERLWIHDRRTMLAVTHDIEEALFADRIIVLGGPPAKIVVERRIDLPRPREPGFRFSTRAQALRAELLGLVGRREQTA